LAPMRLAILTAVTLILLGAASSHAKGYHERLKAADAHLCRAMKKRCPGRAKEIELLRGTRSKAERRALLVKLEPCGRSIELYHLRMGAAHFALDDFRQAEASYRRALALRVTEAAQVGLLTALVRQKRLGPKQRADLRKHLGYFRDRSCRRDDLCAALAYVAWHLDEHELARRAAGRAIAQGYPGWQPYFFGGAAYAVGRGADPKKARAWLLEAKKRGGPAAIDGLLADLPEH